ncbi:MAG: putative holin-like toxin [Clostridium cochlearium]|nr:putative holin-like toxin [Clostridium cochlearium]MDU1444166.1 putative holin-like toxin [Clostridium cochlearium]
MSNDVLMLLFQGGLFLITLLTLIVLLIEKIVAPTAIGCYYFKY